MPEDHDFTPAPWASHDNFKSARAAYDVHVGRSYDDAVSKGIKVSDLVPKSIKSDSTNPIVILCDVTGSMGKWPATIFSKLPYLANEAKFYFGDDYEVSFGAIGDAFGDQYPLQVHDFGKDKDMEATLKKLVVEGGGQATSEESYDLGALYYARNCEMPNAVKPLLIFIGDEGIHSPMYKDKAKSYAKVDIEKSMSVEEIFEELKQKFDVYIIRKPYNTYSNTSRDPREAAIHEQWEKLLGEDHVLMLPEAERVVDVIFGIFAKVTDKVKEFRKELKDRQLKDADGEHKIEIVMKSLNTLHRGAASLPKLPHKHSLKKLAGPVSVTRRSKTGGATKTSKSLMD